MHWVEDEYGVWRLRIKLPAPPVDGKANKELVKFLSMHLGGAKSRSKLVAGEKSRLKTVQVMGLDEEELGRLSGQGKAGEEVGNTKSISDL